MPLYEFKCHSCKIAVEELIDHKKMKSGKAPNCPECGVKMVYTCSQASIVTTNKGPGRKAWGGHFNRVDALKETTNVAAKMEEAGKLRGNPQLVKQLDDTIKHYKNIPEDVRRVDYDEGGHPLD